MAILAWLRLLRLPNHATAAADVLAGFLICSQARILELPQPVLWWALAAGVCLYAAGMVLNDVFDYELDRLERPERPLPTGIISVRTAATVGYALLAMGSVLACIAAFISHQPAVALIGAALTLAIWTYDRHAKQTAFGPAFMGICRTLNWLLGMAAAGGPAMPQQWLLPIGMGMYVMGITLYARDEASRSRIATLVVATLLMLAGLTTTGAYAYCLATKGGGSAWLTAGRLDSWMLLWCVLSISILLRAVLGIIDPSPSRVRAAVGNAIMSIITLDAVLVLSSCSEQWAIVVILLLAPFLFGRQLVSVT